MVLHQVDPIPTPDPDDNFTDSIAAATPPETLAADTLTDSETSFSSIPWPGSTFIIRSVSSGRVITLLNGDVELSAPGGRGSIHWACVETNGWLGFQNLASGEFLGTT
ncbi:hypothetical protein V493_02396 [Pseudogymnoascus sp. VKM F-4281 (FW-2241)]|nr:hypothetical protein V493_02396 [Pseudogymnoascus sp. VKM F-4281 (FW-2241)]